MSVSTVRAWWCGWPRIRACGAVSGVGGHYDHAWSRLSKRVRAEEPVCYFEGCGAASVEADHIVPIAVAPHLRLVRSNVRGSCRRHNVGRVTPMRQRLARVVNTPAPMREW